MVTKMMQLAVEPGVGAHVKAQAQHEKDAEFEAYMAARQPSLLRTAYLISGDRHTAEDLVQTALAKLYLSWDKVHDRQMMDGYVRRIIVNEHNSLWRRPWKRRELSTDIVPDHQTVTEGQWSRFLAAYCGTDDTKASTRALTTRREQAAQLDRLWRQDQRVTPWRGTAYGVLAVANTYAHHLAPVRGATRADRNAERLVTGKVHDLDRHTLQVLATV